MDGEAQVSTSTSTESQAATPPAQETTSTAVETTEHSEASQSSQSDTNSEGKPAGFDRVEFTPEQKSRVDRIYGNMKRYENDAKELRDYNQRLIDTVNQLTEGQQQIVSHLQRADFSEAEGRVRQERDAAWTKGDVNAFNSANDKLVEITAKKLLAEQQKPSQVQQSQQQPRNLDGRQVVNGALDRGAIDHVNAAAVNSWMAETNNDGSPKRSWVNANDPRNFEASKIAEAVLNSPLFVDKPMNEKLKEIDKRMGIQSIPTGQNVMGAGNLTRGKPASNIKLDPKIEQIAIRTKFAGRDPKFTAQDHISAYKKAVEKSQRGSR